MAIDQTALFRQARDNTAAPAATAPDGVSDTTLTDITNLALKNLSRAIPDKTLTYVMSVANQQEYTVSGTPPFVVDVFQDSSGVMASDLPLYDAGPNPMLDGSGAYDQSTGMVAFQSLYEVYLQARQAGRRFSHFEHSYRVTDNPSVGKLNIIPAPTTSGVKIWLIKGDTWTLARCPTHYEPPLLNLIEAAVLAMIANKHSRLAAVGPTGMPIMSPSVRYLMDQADARRKTAKEQIDELRMIEMSGL